MALSKEQLAEYKNYFIFLDFDDNGQMTEEELSFLLSTKISEEDIHWLFHEADRDRSQVLDVTEFILLLDRLLHGSEHEKAIRRAFRIIDADNDDRINASELRSAFEQVGTPCSEEQAAQIVQKWDSNGDGLLTFDEFVRAACS